MKDMMAVRECSSLYILTRQSHMGSLLQERTKGKGFSHSPVQLPVVHHVISCFQDPFHCSVNLKVWSIGWSLRKPEIIKVIQQTKMIITNLLPIWVKVSS